MSNGLSPHVGLDALGDPTRRQIVEAPRAGAKPVGQLAELLPVGRPAVSKHLKVLEGAGLVSTTRVDVIQRHRCQARASSITASVAREMRSRPTCTP